VGGAASNGSSFTVVPAPSITSLSQTSGAVGTAITVTGTNFGATQGSSTIKFNGTTGSPTSWNATTISVLVPTGATTGNVVVHASSVDSNGLAFSVYPTLTSLTPATGHISDSITVAGTNFGATQGASTITFNGTLATPSAWGDSSTTVPVPAGATSGNIVVTVSNHASNPLAFTVILPPTLTSATPSSAHVADAVTLVGTRFSATQGTSTIKFNGTTAIATAWSDTSITADVPIGATAGNVAVTVSNQASNGLPFTVIALSVFYAYDELNRLVQVSDPVGNSATYRYDPVGNLTAIERPGPSGVVISEFTPNSGPVGTSVTIFGSGFSATPAQNTVTFGGTSAYVTSASATQLTTTVPAGLSAGSYTVGVSRPGGSATRDAFVVASASGAPTVSGFLPTLAAAGTALTINGTNFETVPANDNLRLNVAFSEVTSATSTAMQTTVPATATTGRINVATPNGVAASSNYLWVAPPPYVVADVDSTTIMTFGSATPVSVPTTEKIALLAFEGIAGHRAAVSVNDVAGGPVSVFLYGPFGSVAQAANYLLGSGFVETAVLGSTGTYSIVFDPQTPNAITGTLTVHDVPPDFMSAISSGGPSVDVTTTVPGQNGILTFTGASGQKVSVVQSGYNCFSSHTTLLAPDGAPLAGGCGGDFIEPTPLTSAGSYSILIDPSGAAYGTTTVTLYDVPADFSGSIVPGGAPVPVTTMVPGQNARLTFVATDQQRVSLVQSGYNCFTSTTTLLRPDGTTQVSTCGGEYIDVQTLVAGTHTILVDPKYAATGSTTLTLYNVPAESTGTVAIGGSPVAVPLGIPGATGRLTFVVSTGQQVTVHITGNAIGWVTVTLLGTDGVTVLTSTTLPFDSFDLSAVTLGVGTYTIRVDPSGANVGSLNISVTNP
jgi:YD repeat-containing protein